MLEIHQRKRKLESATKELVSGSVVSYSIIDGKSFIGAEVTFEFNN